MEFIIHIQDLHMDKVNEQAFNEKKNWSNHNSILLISWNGSEVTHVM